MILGALNVGVECCARKPKGQFGRQTDHVEAEQRLVIVGPTLGHKAIFER